MDLVGAGGSPFLGPSLHRDQPVQRGELVRIFLSASFLTVAGIGQMFVVTTGRGNIDLSIPSVLTLNAYIALLTVRGQDANLALGVLVALGVGLAVGLFNAALVVRLKTLRQLPALHDWRHSARMTGFPTTTSTSAV